MHQLFEDAGRGQATPAGARGALSPQLPNTSQKDAPSIHKHAQDAPNVGNVQSGPHPRSSCRSTDSILIGSQADPLLAVRLPVTGHTSGSWSDDSVYLNTDTSRKSGLTPSPSQRIQDWLANVDEVVDLDGTTDTRDAESGQHEVLWVDSEIKGCIPVERDESRSSSTALGNSWMNLTASLQVGDAIDDPFIGNDLVHVRSTRWALKKPCTNLRIPPLPTRLEESVPNNEEQLFNPASSKATTNTKGKAEYTTTPKMTPARVDQQQGEGISVDASTDDDGEVELRPLSPNVCIERGPSKYHSSPKSPTRKQAPILFKERRPFIPRPTRFKENFDSSPPSIADARSRHASSAPLRSRN
ncbi:hypothetical protein NX059_005246 [Plenodomus lindquistii]|nr:hypothetical protein NX059_005246 [Plenodomus lindquistii]